MGILALLIAGFFFWSRETEQVENAQPEVEQRESEQKKRSSNPKIAKAKADMSGVKAAKDDPAGALQLEGQVIDKDELPVADAEILMSFYPPRTTQSEQNGTFVFTNLPQRRYRISARSGSRLADPLEVFLTDSTEPVILRLKQAASLQVTVRDGDSDKALEGVMVLIGRHKYSERWAKTDKEGMVLFEGIPEGTTNLEASASGYGPINDYIRISRHGGLEQKRTLLLYPGASVSGSVLDPAGKALADASVSATRLGDVTPLATAKSDEEGQWLFPGLAAGRYKFQASHEGYLAGTPKAVTLDGRGSMSGMRLEVERGGDVQGEVRDLDGERVPGARLRGLASDDSYIHAVSDANGTFHLRGLPRTELRLVARLGALSSDLVDVDLKSKASKTGVVLVLLDGRIQGVVVNSKNEPVADAHVSAFPAKRSKRRDSFIAGHSTNTTDSEGHFSLGGLRPGSYELSAKIQGQPEFARYLNAGSEKVVAHTGDENVRLLLDPNGGLKGRVLTNKQQAPSRFQIFVSKRRFISGFGQAPLFSNEDGSFLLEGIPPGNYTLTVAGDSFLQLVKSNVFVRSEKTRDIGTLVVSEGRSIAGTVVDNHHNPIEGAIVETGRSFLRFNDDFDTPRKTSWEGNKRRTKTGPDGRFLIEGISEKSLAIIAHHRKHGHSKGIEIPGGEENQEIEILLRPEGSLAGVVRRDNQPVAGARVRIKEANKGKLSFMRTSASDGAYQFKRMPEGDYSLSAYEEGRGEIRDPRLLPEGQAVKVKGGEEQRIDITLAPKGAVLTVEVDFRQAAPGEGWAVVKLNSEIEARNFGEIVPHYTKDVLGSKVKTIRPEVSNTTSFNHIKPGGYTVCVLSSACVMSNVILRTRKTELHSLPVNCAIVRVAEGVKEQTVRLASP
ncbi:MAG: carboxypeptidase regulatory-like domain-containing protein [Deltaproteobacteria bacterium]|nr:carboxypeptidase regulatory-like domain-containing protein [Deltaproteobacteria bacterium]